MDAANLRAILDDAHARKAARKGWPQGRPDADAPAKDRVLAMIFEKNSTRTRFSFDAATQQSVLQWASNAKVRDVLGGLGIVDLGLDTPVGSLSGGERRRRAAGR